MTGLLELPVEIIETVLLYMRDGSETETTDLVELCSTCKVLCAIAQPLLYVNVKILEEWFYHDRRNNSPETRTQQLFHTLGIRPDLAEKVRRLSLPLDSRSEVDARINDLRHLGTLHLSFSRSTSKYQPSIFPISKSIPLKELCIESTGHLNLANFGSLLVQPSLQRATLHSMIASYGNAFGKPLNLPQGSLHLSELVLDDCFMRERCLRHFLKACKGLKSFRYRAASIARLNFQGYNIGSSFRLTPEEAVRALGIHVNTLETLSLNFDAGCDESVDDDFYLPSLNKFGKVSRLCIESVRLLSFEDLPPASENVLLTQGHWSMLDHLHTQDPGLIKQRACPNIQSVVLMVTDIDAQKQAYMRFINGVHAESRDRQCNEIRSTKMGFDFLITDEVLTGLDEHRYRTFC